MHEILRINKHIHIVPSNDGSANGRNGQNTDTLARMYTELEGPPVLRDISHPDFPALLSY
jgi:hypothetical protein